MSKYMKMCNETVTVFNRRIDDSGDYIYIPSVISGVSWFCEIQSSVGQNGLNAANRLSVRVPVTANFYKKQYIDPKTYAKLDSVDGYFTFEMGDIIVKAVVTDMGLRPKQIQETYSDCLTIVGVTDNRRAPNAPHWRVIGS